MLTELERTGNQTEAMLRLLEYFSNKIRVAVPGIIQGFDAERQTCTVQVAIKERVTNASGALSYQEIPLLLDVIPIMPRCGGFSITMPILPGDECLVIFADSCIDGWWETGEISNPMEQRRHDLSDGFCILGPWSKPCKLPNYTRNKMVLSAPGGKNKIELGKNGIYLSGNVYINGKNFAEHQHSGVEAGNGVTGGVVV